MQEDLNLKVDGRMVRLHNVGDELWADDPMPRLAHVVVRRQNGLYQADVGSGTASWYDSPERAICEASKSQRGGRSS